VVEPQCSRGRGNHDDCGRRRLARDASFAYRRHSGSLRYPGHRHDRIPWPVTADRRGTGHLSAGVRVAERAWRKDSAGEFVARHVLYLRVVRRQDRLSAAARRLPPGVVPALGPDATSVGWIYQYVVSAPGHDLAQLRSLQDWTLRNGLINTDGVAEIASIGGFVKSYSVVIDPRRLASLGIPLSQVRDALRSANLAVGGRSLDLAESEIVIQGRGYFRNASDIEETVVKNDGGAPVTIRDIGRVEIVGDERRGVAEFDGNGEAVSGIAVQRVGANTLATISNVKDAAERLAKSLPEGATLQPVYDRSGLILLALATLRSTLIQEIAVVALIGFLFLGFVRLAVVPALLLPVCVAITLGLMTVLGFSANIMSLAGIAIAIGAMVDAALVMVENASKRLEQLSPETPALDTVTAAAVEVGPALFHSLLIIMVSFLPIIGLEAAEGRLFRPLAITKTIAMAVAAILSITFVPALMALLKPRGPMPASRFSLNESMIAFYRPVLAATLAHKRIVLTAAALMTIASVWPAIRLGSEFMPPLNEGAILYMPTAQPGLSMTKATELLQIQDQIFKSFSEVDHVLGKAGRANTATDPAPTEMFETTITLKPEEQWRPGMTYDKLVAEMDRALQIPGIANAWTMPIKGRIEMLSTGLRTTLGIKVFGNDLPELERIAQKVADIVRAVPGTTSAYAERIMGGHALDIVPDRRQLARYGLSVADVTGIIASGVGAETITTMIEGRERYPVSLRLPRATRSDPISLGSSVLVALPGGVGTVPLGDVANIAIKDAATSIRSENGRPVAYIYVDTPEKDIGGYVARAQAAIAEKVVLPPGYTTVWSGQYEHLQRAASRLALLIPLTLCLISLLLAYYFKRLPETLMVLLSLPFALTGGIWLQALLGHNLSVASAVGFIALAGVAAETGVVMLVYLDQAKADLARKRHAVGEVLTTEDITAAISTGAVERLRPKLMTVAAILAGLLPMLWSTGVGGEYMERIAVPMLGGIISSAVLTLVVIPTLFAVVSTRAVTAGVRARHAE
jgi:copper/silver efflux system protein